MRRRNTAASKRGRRRWTNDKVHFSLWLEIADVEALESLRGGEPTSAVIRRALHEFLAHREAYAAHKVELAQANLDDALRMKENAYADAARARELAMLRRAEQEDAAWAFLVKNGRTVDDQVRDRKGRPLLRPTRQWLDTRADDLAAFGLTPSTALELIHRRTTK